jgi:hypothetical protein
MGGVATTAIWAYTTDTTIPNTVDMATLSGFADLIGKVADGTIGTTASDTIDTTGMHCSPFL